MKNTTRTVKTAKTVRGKSLAIYILTAFILITCILTACAHAPGSSAEKGTEAAAGEVSSAWAVNALEGEEVSHADGADMENSIEEQDAKLLADCADVKIEKSIETPSGKVLLINAPIDVEGIERVSQYEYILQSVTEELRQKLFVAVFPMTASEAEYDERNDVWTLDIDPEIRNYWLYLISYSNGGATIPGEQIIVLENRYYNLYPFEDNRLEAVADSTVDYTLQEVTAMCGHIVDAITETNDFMVDYVHAYGTNGRRAYYKVVYKRILDGMPVTTFNNLSFLFDNNGVEKVWGSLFSVKEIGLKEPIMSAEEAVALLEEQAAFLDAEEDRMLVTRITLEYVTLMSSQGELLITPVWRFYLGEDEDERNFLCQKILAINAITGELIWEERGHTL